MKIMTFILVITLLFSTPSSSFAQETEEYFINENHSIQFEIPSGFSIDREWTNSGGDFFRFIDESSEMFELWILKAEQYNQLDQSIVDSLFSDNEGEVTDIKSTEIDGKTAISLTYEVDQRQIYMVIAFSQADVFIFINELDNTITPPKFFLKLLSNIVWLDNDRNQPTINVSLDFGPQTYLENEFNDAVLRFLDENIRATFTPPIITRLPWAIGDIWRFTQNFHQSTNALDFQTNTGSPGRVLAADAGTVVWAYETCVLIDRGDGIKLGYQHIASGDIAKFSPGDPISQGQFVGMTTLESGCNGTTDGNLVHFWAEGADNFQLGSIIGGYTVGGICGDAPALNRDGVKYCPITTIKHFAMDPTPPTDKIFSNGSSSLTITQSAVNLTVCADNLSGQTVYATLYRNAVGSEPAKTWSLQRTASSNCTTFSDMDGTGDTYANVTYYTVASLNPISASDAADQRTACYSATGGEQLCDAIQRDSETGTSFTSGVSDLTITQAAVNLEVCASNLSGKTVYATLYRDAYGSNSARTWRYQKTATSNCVTYSDMDGAGDTFSGVTYYTVASLNPISDSDATNKRTACYDATDGRQLCDAKQRVYSGTLFENGYSSLEITQAAVNLRVCANNLSGKSVKATLYRDAYAGYPARLWNHSITASSGCVTFIDMDGAGDTFSGVTYYTVASLNTISDSDASSKRTACYAATGGAQLCDAGMRGTAPSTCYTLTTSSSPSAGGGVEVSPPSSAGCAEGSYTSGTSVTLEAIPASGYTFQSWTGASGGSTTNITITGNKSVTANFTTAVYNTNWMPDAVFTGELDVHQSQIRDFLSDRGSCLANPITDVDGQIIDIPTLVIQASQQYEINPKVILATMQKEQSAITTCPGSYALSALMGAGSPSTAREQIDFGTSLFRAYLTELQNNGVTRSGWKVGIPKTTVDGVTVTPASRAVAALFTYTPYAGVAWGGNMSSVGGTRLFKSSWDIFGFDDPFSPPTCYSLSLSSNPTDGGSIVNAPEPNCGIEKYYEETEVSVWVITYEGYLFDFWSGSISSENDVLNIIMNSDKSVIANFVALNNQPSFVSTPVTGATQDALYTYNITATDPDDGDTLSITATTKPGWLTITDHGNGTATLTGTPTNAEVGDHALELSVEDSGGLTDTQSFTIGVTDVNDPPDFTSTPVTGATQDALYTYNITATDPDDGDTLSITATTKPGWLTITDHGNGTATLTGTPTNAEVGDHALELSVEDSGGLTDTQSFTVVVEGTVNCIFLPLIIY